MERDFLKTFTQLEDIQIVMQVGMSKTSFDYRLLTLCVLFLAENHIDRRESRHLLLNLHCRKCKEWLTQSPPDFFAAVAWTATYVTY